MDLEKANAGLEALQRGEALSEDESFGIEEIVLPRMRPVIDVVDGTFTTPSAPWSHLGFGNARRNIEDAIRSVCRIVLPEHVTVPIAGTGFLVGDNLVMTCRHVAEFFASGVGTNVRFQSGQSCEVDFRGEIIGVDSAYYRVNRIVLIHPVWDMALLEIGGMTESPEPLTLSVRDPRTLLNRDCVVIGFPALKPQDDLGLQNRIFRGVYNVKRVMPGKISSVADVFSFGTSVTAMTHDCSTLGGNSGAAVVDVETGTVVGLHFASRYTQANHAVPVYELAKDPRVVDAGVNFQSSLAPTTDWDVAWAQERVAEIRSTIATPSERTLPVNISVTIQGSTIQFTKRLDLQRLHSY